MRKTGTTDDFLDVQINTKKNSFINRVFVPTV